MGLSRNKVAVPEGAAGTPPFWSARMMHIIQIINEERQAEKTRKTSHPVRTLLLVHNFRSVKIITVFDILQAKANLSKVRRFERIS